MKIALYLGSFNPFHNGHLEVVKTALTDFKMDGVIVVPTMQNPWKKEKVLDIDKRIEIIKSIINSENEFIPNYNYRDFDGYWKKSYIAKNTIISSIEKKLIPPYYSYSTLHALKNKYCNDEIFILCGEDTMSVIPYWMNGEQIIQDYNFLICNRTKESSTEIRNRVKNNEDIGALVSPNAINIIKNYYKS